MYYTHKSTMQTLYYVEILTFWKSYNSDF